MLTTQGHHSWALSIDSFEHNSERMKYRNCVYKRMSTSIGGRFFFFFKQIQMCCKTMHHSLKHCETLTSLTSICLCAFPYQVISVSGCLQTNSSSESHSLDHTGRMLFGLAARFSWMQTPTNLNSDGFFLFFLNLFMCITSCSSRAGYGFSQLSLVLNEMSAHFGVHMFWGLYHCCL